MANDYQKQYIDLVGGLDYSTSPLNARAGSLSQCLNFETTDSVGVKRISGFERFDGTMPPSMVYKGAVKRGAGVLSTPQKLAVRAGGLIFDATTLTLLGIVLSYTQVLTQTHIYAVEVFTGAFTGTSQSFVFTAQDDSSPTTSHSEAITFTFSTSVSPTVSGGTFPALTLATLQTSYETIRDRKLKFKQSRIAHGLHYFKERLWAVVDFESILVQQTGANAGVLTAGVIYPGDVVYNGSKEAVVLDVKILDGAWAQPHPSDSSVVTLEAKLLIRRTAGTDDPIFAFGDEIGIKRNGSSISSDVMTVMETLVSDVPDTWSAGLYYSQSESQADSVAADYGWQQYEHPWEFTYKDGKTGNSLPPTEYLRKYREAAEQDAEVSTDTGYNAPGTGVGEGSVNSGFVLTTIGDLASDDGNYESVYSNSVGQLGFDSNVNLTNFSFTSEVPEDAIITGVEVIVVARKNASAEASSSTVDPYLSAVTLLGADATSENKGSVANIFSSTSDTTYTFGGQYDKWGVPGLGTTQVRDAAFGVRLSFSLNGGVFGSYNNQAVCDVDQVNVKVYYTKASTTYYFWNGTNDVTAKVLRVHTAKGDWGDDNDKAQGTIIVTEVTSASGRNHIQIGDEMRTAAAHGGDLVCVVTSNMVVCATASLNQILDASSRLQFVTANFYGDATWNSMYCATGASRAFSFDGTYFQKIFTGLVEEKDKPRHVRAYKVAGAVDARLALGFPSGNVTFSVEGEPENYKGIDGATSIDVGNRVTGLANMQGTTLGVFCESAIYGIQGLEEGSPLIGLRPKGGAIEYTVQEVGSDVLYCDVYGIHSLQQSDVYGDFVGQPISYAVSSWLQPRLLKQPSGSALSGLSIVHNSSVARANNQYLLYFRDGYVLSLTFRGPERIPEFTTQRYAFTEDSVEYVYVPIALCSEIDEYGRERRFMSHYDDYTLPDSASKTNDLQKYVYELNSGWSFDGRIIPCSFTPYYNFFDQKFFDFKVLRKVTAYGLSRNLFNLTVYPGSEFEDASETNGQAIDFTRAGHLYVEESLTPQSCLANVASRGVCTTIKFVGSTTQVEPPGIVQGLLLQYMLGKGDE